DGIRDRNVTGVQTCALPILNGTDIRLLREMLGWDIEGHETPGQLVEMDLSEAKIVEGGSSYYGSRYTRRDTLDYGMFLRCSQLRSEERRVGKVWRAEIVTEC